MEDTKQTEEGTSLLDIIKLLLSKIKILILVIVIGAIVGGGIAVIRTINIDYWGTTVEFYVNPEKKNNQTDEPAPGGNAAAGSQYGVYGAYGRHVMDNIVKLLNSEIFAETLILDGKPLPEKDVWVNKASADEVALKLNDKIDAAAAAQEIADKLQEEADVKYALISAPATDYTNKTSKLNIEWKSYRADFNTALSSTFNEDEYLQKVQGKTEAAALDNAYSEWKDAKTLLTTVQTEANNAQKDANKAQTDADEKINVALDAWRQTAKYKSTHTSYKDAVSYSYLADEEDFDDANNLARSFIYVNISVLDNKDFAKVVLERVKKLVPLYIEANMAIPDGYSGTNCQRITTKDFIDLTNPGYTRNEAFKSAILVALVAAVIACIVIIIVDKSDKRLRDTESITKLFDVPVLGIVPTIEELAEESNTKKNAKTEVK